MPPILTFSIAALAAGCGRSGLPEPEKLIVQVVDEQDEPVVEARVELGNHADTPLDSAVTSELGVAFFDYPGPGVYHLHAVTGLRCCIREGRLAATVEDPGDVLVIDAKTGPCPTFTPESCR